MAMFKIFQGERPDLPEDCPPFLSHLIEDCWASEPDDRPTSEDIIVEAFNLQRYPLKESNDNQ